MKDTFTILKIERYKELSGLLIGIRYSEHAEVTNWSLVCKGKSLSMISDYLKSNNYECLLKKGDLEDEIEVSLKINVEDKLFVGSYIPKEIDKLYDEFYAKIKECIKEVKDYAD